MTSDMADRQAGRTLPRGLAPIVEELELQQAQLVTTGDLGMLRDRAGIRTPANVLASRLREHGWLLPTPRRGVYEFSPGSHAGPRSRGDATLALQAALHHRPQLAAGLTMQSAAWALGAADRAPTRLEVAAASREVARALSSSLSDRARVLVFAPNLAWQKHRGVPVLSAESVLVHMAAHPAHVRSWSSALEWIPELAAEVTAERISAELEDRPYSVASRLAYLLSGLRPDLDLAQSSHGKVYFGPRGPLLRHAAAHQIADTLLPFDPRTLSPVNV